MEFKSKLGGMVEVDIAELPDETVLRTAQEALDVIEARQLIVPSVGVMAVRNEAKESADQLSRERLVGENLRAKDFAEFLNPEVKLPLDDQLKFMELFLADRKLAIPELNTTEKASISSHLELHPGHRVIPTPLLDYNGRNKIATAHQVTFDIKQDDRAFSVNGRYQWRYDTLMSSPSRRYEAAGNSTFGLGYKTSAGEVLPYNAYTKMLLETGEAKRAEDGTVWVFPVIDVQNTGARENVQNGDELTANPDLYANNAETLMIIQLLHLANGTASEERFRDITNEGIYLIDQEGSLALHARVTCLDWRPGSNGVSLVDFNASHDSKLFGVRSGTSGLPSNVLAS